MSPPRMSIRAFLRPSLPLALLALAGLGLFSACALPGIGSPTSGVSFALSLSGLSAPSPSLLSRTLWPDGNEEILTPAHYRVYATGPSGPTLAWDFNAGDPMEEEDLLPGSWTFGAFAYNDQWSLIAESENLTVSLTGGQSATIPLTLKPDWASWADGSFTLGLGWAAPFQARSANAGDGSPSTISLRGLLGDGAGQTLDLASWVAADRASASGSQSLRPGVWRLDISLNEYGDCNADGIPDQAGYWGLSEILYIGPSRDTSLIRSLSPSELQQMPAPLWPSLPGGVLVCDAADAHPSHLFFHDLSSGTRVVYTYDGSIPSLDALGNPLAGSYAIDAGEAIRMGQAEDLLDGADDEAIRLTWLTWNPWGVTTQMSADYFLDEAVHVDSSAAVSLKLGTAGDPLTSLAQGAERAGAMGRDAMTTLRAAVGSYVEEVSLSDGIRLSGSWTNAAGAWSRNDAALADPATYTAANATLISHESPVDGVVDAWYANDLGLALEYLAIEGPSSQANPALFLSHCQASLDLDHLRLTGRNGMGDSAALSLEEDWWGILTACLVEGRASSLAPSAGSTTAFIAGGSSVHAYDSTFKAGPAAPGYPAHGITAREWTLLRLHGCVVSGAPSAYPAMESYGLAASNQSWLSADLSSSFDSGSAEATGRAIGISLETSWADLDGVTITARDNCSESIGIHYSDGIGDPNCGNSLGATQLLSLSGSSVLRAGFPGAAPAQWATGLRLLSGRAVVEGCQLIEAAAATEDSTGIWAGSTASGHWADISVTGNQSILSGFAVAGRSSALRLEGAVRASIEGNQGSATQPGISGGSGGSMQAGILVSSPSSITVYPEGPSILIQDNWIQGAIQGGTAPISSFGVRLEGASCSWPILIDRNRIHAGSAGAGELSGIWIGFDTPSQPGGDIVIRNNAVSGGSYADAAVFPWRAGIHHLRVFGHSQRLFLLSNSVLGPEGPTSLVAPVANTGALSLSGYADPTAFDNILMARPWNRASLVRESASALPLELRNNAFFSSADNGALWYDESSASSSNDPDDTAFFPIVGDNLSLSTADVFSSPLPASPAAFFSHPFALDPIQAAGDEGILDGGLDLSAQTTMNASASPWWFAVDLSGTARSAPWSIGAREAP